MEKGFDHTEQTQTRLTERLGFLTKHVERKLSSERKRQISHEMACLVFELLQREQEEKRRQQEVAWLEFEAGQSTQPLDLSELQERLRVEDEKEE